MDVKQPQGAAASSQGAATSSGRNDQTSQKDTAQRDARESGQREGRERGQRGGESNRMARRGASPLIGPFALLQRILTDDIASFFGEQRGGRLGRPQGRSSETGDALAWTPKIDVVQRDNNLVIRADLPGVTPDDVTVEIAEDAIIISGQRREEHVEEEGGVYRLERTFGAFYREIPLPEGAIPDQATATFRDGVLEITMPAPPEQVSRGRRLEIQQDRNKT